MSRPRIPSKRPADAQEAAWIADEDRFVLQQAKKKAAIRAKGGRAQPIDWLAVTLAVIDREHNSLDDEVDLDEIDLKEPESVFERLDRKGLDELRRGIDSYLDLESSKSNRDYWMTLKTICHDRQNQSESQPSARGVSSVTADLDRLLGPKSLTELETLEKQIRTKLESNELIDTDYWEHLLKTLLTYKAKAKLRRVSDALIGSRLEGLRKQQAEDAAKWKALLGEGSSKGQAEERGQEMAESDGRAHVRHPLDPEPMLRLQQADKSLDSTTENEFAELRKKEREEVRKRGYIPAFKRPSGGALEPSSKRQRIDTGLVATLTQSTQQSAFDREVTRGLSDNEEIFNAEVPVTTKSLAQWGDKYRPRKPRYFNRVVIGYEWNKYNQTHYDHDNPPPKIVQGYKFNVFYPDLVDKTTAPTYKIEREGGRRRGEMSAPAGEDDTCVIRFVAGPPYEDIAFRIVDKEWDYSAKRERGFKSSFDKGVLQLHFQFKKIYYRK